MKKSVVTILSFLLIYNLSFGQLESDTLSVEEQKMLAFIDSVENALKYEYGQISLEDGIVSLTVPKGYKFLGAEQSAYVLTDLWGNPPSEGTLGLLFPENTSPLSDDMTYAVQITYSDEGYVDDEDAANIDYDELLEQMKNETSEASTLRVEEGYEAIELVGWASAPFYDAATKKLHWAKEIKFGNTPVNTLNYNIRILGREGFLNMNAIGDISILPTFEKDIDQILASAEFNEGNLYSDFNPDIDNIAAYGIGGLIAGKVLAKAGFFAVILKFWKIIAIGFAGFFAAAKKFIFKKKDTSEV